MQASSTIKSFSSFTWFDFCNPTQADLKEIAAQYQLDLFQIMDSLEVGHLPKYEQQANYNFLILRAYTAQPNDRVNSISDISNKIAFFYNDDKLITIHRTPFAFLQQLSSDYSHCEALLLAIVKAMVDTYNEPSKLLSDQIDAMEQTIFLRDYKKISLTELYFQKTKTLIFFFYCFSGYVFLFPVFCELFLLTVVHKNATSSSNEKRALSASFFSDLG